MCSTKNAIGFVGGNPKGSCRRCLLLSSSSHHHHHHDHRSVLLLLLLLLPWFFLLCYRWLSLKKLICSFGVPLLEIFRFLLLEVFVLRALSLSPLLSSRDFFNFNDGGLKNVRWWRPRNRESVSAKCFFAFGVFFFPRLKQKTKYVRDFLGSLFVAVFLGKETSRSRDQLAGLPCV